MRIIALIIAFALLIVKVNAQNKKDNKSTVQSLANKAEIPTFEAYSIRKDSLRYRNTSGSAIQNVLLYNNNVISKIKFDTCVYHCPFFTDIDSCFFTDDENFPFTKDCRGKNIRIEMEEGFQVKNCKFSDELAIRDVIQSRQKSQVLISNNTSQYINLSDNEIVLLNLFNNTVEKDINVSFQKIGLVNIAMNVVIDNNYSLSLSYSNIKTGCSIVNNNAVNTKIDNVELNGVLNIQSLMKPEAKEKQNRIILISNSLINAQCYIAYDDMYFNSKLIFDNCTFGAKASLFNLKVDTVIFKNCTDIPYPLFVSADSAKKEVFIELVNSNVNNLRFDYTDKFQLFFGESVSEETKNNTYQSLLAKYKLEGKPQNIEKIDIEYKRHQYKTNWLMWPVWLLDYVWWRYGYSKWLVIVWTLVFLGVFFTYNFRNWDGMRRIYGVFDKEELAQMGQLSQKKRNRRKASFVLLYTSYIFFSLRIEFDKLKYASTKFLTAFFVQYIVGLICLFFLANAIFKLG